MANISIPSHCAYAQSPFFLQAQVSSGTGAIAPSSRSDALRKPSVIHECLWSQSLSACLVEMQDVGLRTVS